MHKFKMYDQVTIMDWGKQYTTPKDTDIIALTQFQRSWSPPSIGGEDTRTKYRIRGEIVKLIDTNNYEEKYGIRLPAHNKLMNSDAFNDLANALQTFNSAIEKLNS